jgi:hypothetical protein
VRFFFFLKFDIDLVVLRNRLEKYQTSTR